MGYGDQAAQRLNGTVASGNTALLIHAPKIPRAEDPVAIAACSRSSLRLPSRRKLNAIESNLRQVMRLASKKIPQPWLSMIRARSRHGNPVAIFVKEPSPT